MSLITRIQDLATRIATECKALRTMVNGNATDLSALTTTAKGNLVVALNELKAAIDSATGSEINDAITATDKTWSSTKTSAQITAAINAVTNGSATALDTLSELAAALGNDANFAANITAALGSRVRFDAAQSLTVPQQTQARANIGAQEAALIGDPDTNLVNTFNTGLI